jgi:hypothetical protein
MISKLVTIKTIEGRDRHRITIKSEQCFSEDALVDLLHYVRKFGETWNIERVVIFLQNDIKTFSEIRMYIRGNIDEAMPAISRIMQAAVNEK